MSLLQCTISEENLKAPSHSWIPLKSEAKRGSFVAIHCTTYTVQPSSYKREIGLDWIENVQFTRKRLCNVGVLQADRVTSLLTACVIIIIVWRVSAMFKRLLLSLSTTNWMSLSKKKKKGKFIHAGKSLLFVENPLFFVQNTVFLPLIFNKALSPSFYLFTLKSHLVDAGHELLPPEAELLLLLQSGNGRKKEMGLRKARHLAQTCPSFKIELQPMNVDF